MVMAQRKPQLTENIAMIGTKKFVLTSPLLQFPCKKNLQAWTGLGATGMVSPVNQKTSYLLE